MAKKKIVRRRYIKKKSPSYGNNPSRVNISPYSKKLPKDVLTTDVIDYDFLKVALNPPKKQKRAFYYQTLYVNSFNDLFYVPKKKKQNGGGSGGGDGFFTRGGEHKQRCVIKVFFGKDKNAHIKFLKTYMTQKNKEAVEDKPVLFNSANDIVPDNELLEYEKKMVGLHYKFIISPESQKIPIENLVRSFVKQLEAASGYSFDWLAVKHSDTGHIHSHILINGVDKNGKDVVLDRQLKYETARKIAVNLCTHYAGTRSKDEILASRGKALEAFHFTQIDNEISKYEETYSETKSIAKEEYEGEIIARNENMLKRLNILSKMGFARKKEKCGMPPVYHLVYNWQKSLKSARYFNSFLKARTSLLYTSASHLEQYKKEMGIIEGVITQRFVMNDEDNWNNAVVIEDKKTGAAYYVPIGFKPEQSLIGSSATCYTPQGSMHPKIVVNGRRKSLEKK